MSNNHGINSAPGNHRLLLLPTVDNNMSPQTLAMAAALQEGGFEVDIADVETEAGKLLIRAPQAEPQYPLVILGLGLSPVDADHEKIKQIADLSPSAFIVACAAECSDGWEAKARKLAHRGQIILLDNPVDTVMLRRLATSLVATWEKNDAVNRKLERMIRTVSACAHEISIRKEEEEEASSFATTVVETNKTLEKLCEASEAAAAAKSEFLANMSHEIRTPMTAILGFAEELLEPNLPKCERIAAATTIQRNGKHLLSIINDILDISKIEAGKLQIEKIACSPAQLVEDVRVLMDERARRKHLEFTTSALGTMPETILGDPTRIRQILINLIGNAIKFTDHGQVKISYGLEQKEDAEENIFFEISDTGIGMTHEQIQRLFSPFSQADSSITRKFGGSGLGLTICKHLAEKLGGRISVTSSLGQGSTFRVVMPVEICTENEPGGEGASAGSCEMGYSSDAALETSCGDLISGRRILVAEDAPDNQRIIRVILEKAGAQVSMADNGKTAVEMSGSAMRRGEPFDLVLMDIQMPILDGYRATRLLRENGYSGPIVALTAHALGCESEKTREAGCNAYLPKPFTREGLLSVIADLVCRGEDACRG